MAAWLKNKIDEELFLELQKLPGLLFHRSIKQDTQDLHLAREEFLKNGTLPDFKYTQADEIDIDNCLQKLDEFETKISHTNKTIVKLYKNKTRELKIRAKLVQAIQNKDDETVTRLSAELFGNQSDSISDFESEFQEMLTHVNNFHQHERPVNAELFKQMIQETLNHYNMDSWSIRISNTRSVQIKHGFVAHGPVIHIPKSLKISKARATRLLVHEIEVHALRTHNGSQKKLAILERGLDKYIPIDEGLAIYYQTKIASKEHSHAPGFWDAWTGALTKVGNFKETFNTIKDARTTLAAEMKNEDPKAIGEDAAWRLCLRSYRGINDLSKPGVGFQRDHIYRTGNAQIHEAIKKHGEEILPMLFCGNVGLHHLESLKELEIEPGKLPDMIGKEIVKKVLKQKTA